MPQGKNGQLTTKKKSGGRGHNQLKKNTLVKKQKKVTAFERVKAKASKRRTGEWARSVEQDMAVQALRAGNTLQVVKLTKGKGGAQGAELSAFAGATNDRNTNQKKKKRKLPPLVEQARREATAMLNRIAAGQDSDSD